MTPAEQLIKAAGLRCTAQRRTVLTALLSRPHATATELAAAVTLSHQGLYNVLDDLTRAGIVRVIEPAGSPTRYETRVGDNHHHLICRDCGVVTDIDCPAGTAPCFRPAETPGFAAVHEAEVTWWGTCTTCAEHPTGTPRRSEGARS
ncbi:Fur family transcriptional regulator [Actinoplanes sp. NPDC051494]|uniref:Fur family transcriptional regulator n=1 Tax=Actinoplanes sp. NPDC051494 TaxID=3363907 RepID=UPI00378B6523